MTDEVPPDGRGPVFVAWSFMRRAESMQPYFGFSREVIDWTLPRRWMRPAEYVGKGIAALRLILQRRPTEIWVQLAPTPLLYVAHIGSRLLGGVPVVADCHNSMLERPWIRHPLALRLLGRCRAVIVHNEQVLEKALSFGLAPEQLFVLEERPAQQIGWGSGSVDAGGPPTVILPCSFNADEPVAGVIEAARLLPHVRFVLTGDFRRAHGRHSLENAPQNVELTGYLSTSDFDARLRSADVLLGLTDRPDVQLSSAGEGVGVGCPMVLSATRTLTELYPKGSVFLGSHAGREIARGIQLALRERPRLRAEVKELARRRSVKWERQAGKLAIRLGRESLKTNASDSDSS